MKKRILLIGLILTIILTLAMPTAAFAQSNAPDKCGQNSGSFTATTMVYISDAGTSFPWGKRIITRGEIMQSAVPISSEWSVVNGATIKVNHASEITMTPTSQTTGTFSGNATNFIEVTLADGKSKLYGVAPTKLNGSYTLIPTADPYKPITIFNNVVNTGNFNVAGQTADGFVQGHGSLNAALQFNGTTLVGPLTFTGTYNMVPKSRFGR